MWRTKDLKVCNNNKHFRMLGWSFGPSCWVIRNLQHLQPQFVFSNTLTKTYFSKPECNNNKKINKRENEKCSEVNILQFFNQSILLESIECSIFIKVPQNYCSDSPALSFATISCHSENDSIFLGGANDPGETCQVRLRNAFLMHIEF